MTTDPATKTFDFSSIRVVGTCLLMIQRGEKAEIIIDNRGSKIDTQFEVQDHELLIYSVPDHESCPERSVPKITLIYIQIKSIILTGSIDLRTGSQITGHAFALLLNGTGNISLEVGVVNLNCTIVKAGTIRVFGDTVSSFIMLLGTGIYQGQDLDSGVVSVEITNQGTAAVSAESDLTGSITGGGTLYYKGTPSIKELLIEGNSKLLPFNGSKSKFYNEKQN